MFPEALLRPTAEQVLLVAVPAVAVALWFVALRIALHLTRPRPGRALPATQDLGGDEPPAVVSLLVNRWRVTEDAVEATLVDLAARDHLEFRQLSDDPMATTADRKLPHHASAFAASRKVRAVTGATPPTATAATRPRTLSS